MKKRINLDSGFLILYDWLPLLNTLSNKDYRLLMDALIARQRENKPLPTFQRPLVNSIAYTIEAVIKRRLEGAAWAQKGQTEAESSEDTPEGSPTTKEKENIRTEKSSQAERSGEEVPPPPPAALRALSEDEKALLIEEGLPAAYIEAREVRACDHANASGRDVLAVLCDWWKQDKRLFNAAQKKREQQQSSFDVDEFWEAACRRTYGE